MRLVFSSEIVFYIQQIGLSSWRQGVPNFSLELHFFKFSGIKLLASWGFFFRDLKIFFELSLKMMDLLNAHFLLVKQRVQWKHYRVQNICQLSDFGLHWYHCWSFFLLLHLLHYWNHIRHKRIQILAMNSGNLRKLLFHLLIIYIR